MIPRHPMFLMRHILALLVYLLVFVLAILGLFALTISWVFIL